MQTHPKPEGNIKVDKKESISYWDSYFFQQKGHETVDFREGFLAPLKRYRNIKVLDVGCGAGTLTRLIAEFQRENFVVGIDFSKRSIEYACRELRKTNANVEFIRGFRISSI